MSETNLSTYPIVDTFDRYSDLDATTMAMAEIYKGYIDAGQYETAATYLTNHPDLEACGITAEIINKHSDAIVAVETYLNDTRTYLNQTAGVVSGLMTTAGMLQSDMSTAKTNISTAQSDIAGLKDKNVITSEEKIIGTIGGFTHCQISVTWLPNALGTATSNSIYTTAIKPGLDGDYYRYVFSIDGVLIDNGEQIILYSAQGSIFGYNIITSGGMQGINIYYTNASETATKKIIILIDYLRETA
jgi:hypothetical protein